MWSHSFALKRERHDDVAILCIIDRDATYIHVCYLLWLLSQALKANVNVSFEHHFKMEICPAFDQVSGTSCIVCMVVWYVVSLRLLPARVEFLRSASFGYM
jgi:hypothetical protein